MSLSMIENNQCQEIRNRLDAAPDDSQVVPVEDFLADKQDDSTFDMLWVQNLVQVGMLRLDEDCAKRKTPYFEALKLYSGGGKSYDEIAEKLGATRTDIKNYIHQGRGKLKKFLLEEIESYSSSPAEYKEEVEYLLNYLK